MNAAGLYIHVPFCRRKCPYCDFASTTALDLKPAYLEALQSEIASAPELELPCDTVYFGGGTPSLLAPGEVADLLAALRARFRIGAAAEITLEANPGTVDRHRLAAFRAAGVNRLNVGVQSFRPENLAFLGRIHTAAEAEATLAAARAAGFDNLGVDLMYGLPGQGRAAWGEDLAKALDWRPEHVSAYMLTVEAGTPLADAVAAGRTLPPREEAQADLFLMTAETLEAAGYRHYEISNHARRDPAAEGGAWMSRHNLKYWRRQPYLGFGPAAHSFLPPRRFWNPRSTRRWIARVAAGDPPREGEEALTLGQELLETIMLGLRTDAGVDTAGFGRRFGVDFQAAFGEAAAGLVAAGLLVWSGARVVPTRRGMLFHDSLAVALAARLD